MTRRKNNIDENMVDLIRGFEDYKEAVVDLYILDRDIKDANANMNQLIQQREEAVKQIEPEVIALYDRFRVVQKLKGPA